MGTKKDLYLGADGFFVKGETKVRKTAASVDSDYEDDKDVLKSCLQLKSKVKTLRKGVLDLTKELLDNVYLNRLSAELRDSEEDLDLASKKVKEIGDKKHEWFSPGNVDRLYRDINGTICVKDEIDWKVSDCMEFTSWLLEYHATREDLQTILKKHFNALIATSVRRGRYSLPGVEFFNVSRIKTRLASEKVKNKALEAAETETKDD